MPVTVPWALTRTYDIGSSPENCLAEDDLIKALRDVAIIAHVDHGKTTLVDQMLRAARVFRDNQVMGERVLDSNDLERERGITILSKICAVEWRDTKINILDTPGHSDFGGEVERVLRMADAALLLVDAAEGPMPQTRFVLRKAFAANLTPVVVINKCDRPERRVSEVLDEVMEMFIDVTASGDDSVLDFPVIYASAKNGWATLDMDLALSGEARGVEPLLDAIVDLVESPRVRHEGPLSMLVSAVEYDDFVGRIAVGRVDGRVVRAGEEVLLMRSDGSQLACIPKQIQTYTGLKRHNVDAVMPGDIAALVGLEGVDIGDSVTSPDDPRPVEGVKVDEPTVAMLFRANDSPFRGREGKQVTNRQVRDRLMREVRANVAMRVLETETPDTMEVRGRGVLHLGILVETMCREGFEFTVSRPRVILRSGPSGEKLEPIEVALVDVPESFSGKVIELLCARRGELVRMDNREGSLVRLELQIPARGLIGVRTRLLNATSGEAVLHHQFLEYGPWRGNLPRRSTGAMVSGFEGEVTSYAVDQLQGRGTMFVGPTDRVYEGMVVGEHVRDEDIVVNVCKKRQLTNMRAASADRKLVLTPPLRMSVEESLEYIGDDELLEVTPKSLRLRKKILTKKDRKRVERYGE